MESRWHEQERAVRNRDVYRPVVERASRRERHDATIKSDLAKTATSIEHYKEILGHPVPGRLASLISP